MKKIEEILDLCLEELNNGKPLPEVLAAYPEQAEELRPLLLMAVKVQSVPKPEPSLNAMHNALVEAGRYIPAREKSFSFRLNLDWLFAPGLVLARAAAVLLIVTLLSWSAVIASANAVPGDLLYPLKLAGEQIKLLLTIRPEGTAELRLTFSEERMKELLARYHKKGVVDNQLINAMLDEAKQALNEAAALPKAKQSLFYSKFNHFNSYQKDTLQSIQPYVSGRQREYVSRAIDICSHRGVQMQQMMQQMMGSGQSCPMGVPSDGSQR